MSKFLFLFLLIISIPCHGQDAELSIFKRSGLDVEWKPGNAKVIAYACKGKDGYYDIHITTIDTLWDTCLTCNHPLLPNRHIGGISWHPSGKWMLCIAEKARHPRGSFTALPGFGAYSDLWIISTDRKQAFKLFDIPNDYDHGIIFAHFSPDGKRIVWTERIRRPGLLTPKRQFGYWVMVTADFFFSKDSIPYIANAKPFAPGGPAFYETYGFTDDNSRIIFCSSFNQPSAWTQQIFSMDTLGNNISQLTDTAYNEHARLSPSGNKIIWMTSLGNKNKGTDWWMMNVDGSGKKRLTYMNISGHKNYMHKVVWAGFGSFSPDEHWYIGGVQKSLITQEGMIMLMKVNSE